MVEAMDERPILGDSHMSDLEAMMWNLEKDPHLAATFGTVSILDRPADLDRIVTRMAYASSVVPRLRQRVVPGLGRLAPPEWRDDPDFDLHYHVRQVALPGEAGRHQLFELAPLMLQDQFDRTRPLWEMVLVEGLEGGRGAIVQKMHHTITDGEGGIRMSELMVDIEPDATDPEPVETELCPAPPSNIFQTTVETLGHQWRRTAGTARRANSWVAGATRHPSRWAELSAGAGRTGRAIAHELGSMGRSRSPLWRDRTLSRYFVGIDIPFDDARRTAKDLGGTLNDFFVTGAAMAAGTYHAARGEPVEHLRMAMPISFRREGEAGGNAFTATRAMVPVAADDTAQLFELVHERLSGNKSSATVDVMGMAAGLLNALPTSMLVRLARQQTESIDFTTSNVRAAPFELYLGGGRIEATYPLGPVAGTAFNLTMMSYNGMLNMGLHIDNGAVEDAELLARLLEESYDRLITAAG